MALDRFVVLFLYRLPHQPLVLIGRGSDIPSWISFGPPHRAAAKEENNDDDHECHPELAIASERTRSCSHHERGWRIPARIFRLLSCSSHSVMLWLGNRISHLRPLAKSWSPRGPSLANQLRMTI